MSQGIVKGLWVGDLALIELLAGKTDAPADVLEKLRVLGNVTLSAGKAALTPKGRRRAERLRPMEHDLRLLHAGAAGSEPLKTVAGAALHVTGGPARITT